MKWEVHGAVEPDGFSAQFDLIFKTKLYKTKTPDTVIFRMLLHFDDLIST